MESVKFVVLASPRSGSTVFRLWLNSHRNIRCHDEVLAKKLDAQDSIHHYFKHTLGQDTSKGSYDRDMLGHPNDACTVNLLRGFLDDLFNNRDRCDAWTTPANINDFHPMTNFDEMTAVGFKLMTYSLDNHFINQWLSMDRIRIVHLVRENSLKQLISSQVAKKRKVWFSDKQHKPTTINLDIATLTPFLTRIEQMNAGIQNRFSNQAYIRVTYEEFCSAPGELAGKMCEYLEVPGASLKMPTLKKLNPMNISDIVENYDDVKTALSGTGFAKFLDEPETAA